PSPPTRWRRRPGPRRRRAGRPRSSMHPDASAGPLRNHARHPMSGSRSPSFRLERRPAARILRTMNIVVCTKQIPDPALPGELDPDHTLKREGKLILDESDSYGVEMALQLADKAGGG